ncbi:hypothetical protein HQ545_02060 [Candidatus Woesearchaeota archaeon]|nr:hypothetical protein [Candidatus Woesearchaeota archaeon]
MSGERMTSFFTSENPIALLLALVLTLAVIKAVLTRIAKGEILEILKGKLSDTHIPVIIIVFAVLLVIFLPILKIISFSIPFLAALLVMLVAIGFLLATMGMKTSVVWETMKNIGPLKFGIKIAVICIIAFAASTVYGERLLEDKSVSLTDSILPEQEGKEIDFSSLFTKQALGLIMILIIMGMAFVFVNSA